MTLTIGTPVLVKDTYVDEDCSIPLTGTVKDILDYDGFDHFVVMFDEATLDAGMPPGGEFSFDRLAPV
jgi:hypothetical protein